MKHEISQQFIPLENQQKIHADIFMDRITAKIIINGNWTKVSRKESCNNFLEDPRYFWWNMLNTHTSNDNKILNIGTCSPPSRRDETITFIAPDSYTEMDINKKKSPDIVGDVTNPPESLSASFDRVLFFGVLPFLDNPANYLNISKVLKPGGKILIGAAASDSYRGFEQDSRFPIWRPDKGSLTQYKKQMNQPVLRWSFDLKSFELLFSDYWKNIKYEKAGHCWFAVGEKNENL
jgi:SAM-dependent methyltransferase